MSFRGPNRAFGSKFELFHDNDTEITEAFSDSYGFVILQNLDTCKIGPIWILLSVEFIL